MSLRYCLRSGLLLLRRARRTQAQGEVCVWRAGRHFSAVPVAASCRHALPCSTNASSGFAPLHGPSPSTASSASASTSSRPASISSSSTSNVRRARHASSTSLRCIRCIATSAAASGLPGPRVGTLEQGQGGEPPAPASSSGSGTTTGRAGGTVALQVFVPMAVPVPGASGLSMQQGAGEGAPAQKKKLGALQSVPVVSPAKEQLASAIKRAARTSHASGIKSEAERERSKAARQMDTLMKELSVPLTRYLSKLPEIKRLHPFERALLQLTVGEANYQSIKTKVDGLRKSLQETGKSYASQASKAPNKAAAIQAATDGLERLTALYQQGARHIEALREATKKLRTLPLVDTELPTIALVGAPNVGKSSLVKQLSSGTPEVCNYPFTTRSIKMGHFYIDGRKHQVTDTPGILNRGDAERNRMEMLTLAVLEYLPTSVLFVMDLTEECGTSVADQWAIRAELAQRFPDKPWLDVLSKSDVLQGVLQDGAELREREERQAAAAVAAGSGVAAAAGSELEGTVVAAAAVAVAGHHSGASTSERDSHDRLNAVDAGAESRHAKQQQQQGEGEQQHEVAAEKPRLGALPLLRPGDETIGAEEVVARLSDALPVSSLTETGIAELKGRVMEQLLVHYAMQEERWAEEGEEGEGEEGVFGEELGAEGDDHEYLD